MGLTRRDEAPRPIVVPTSTQFEGNDGKWSTFFINVNTQEFRVTISTAGSSTWIPMQQGCTDADPSNCPDLRGVENTGGAKSRGYAQSSQFLLGEYSLELDGAKLAARYGSTYNINGSYYHDTVGSGHVTDPDSWQFPYSPVAGLTDKSFLLGSFGLGILENKIGNGVYRPYVWSLWNYTKIPSKSYGYTAGAAYRQPPLQGSLVLGGYDKSRFAPSKYSYPLANSSPSIHVQSIIITDSTNHQSATLDDKDFYQGFNAVIDSTLPYLWLPQAVCDQFEKIFGLSYDTATGLYRIDENTRQANIKKNPSVVLALAENRGSFNVTTVNLTYSAFDLEASWPIYNNSTRYFPIRRGEKDNYVLGRSFLQETYLTVDYERKNFSISPAILNPSSQSLVPINMPVTVTKKSGLSKGAIAGIAAGIVILFLVAALALFIFWRKRQKCEEAKKEKQRLEEEEANRASPTETSTVVGADGSVINSPTASELPDVGRRISEMATAGHEYFSPHHRKASSGASHELESPGDSSPGTRDKSEVHQWMPTHTRKPSEMSAETEIHEMPVNEPVDPAQQQKTSGGEAVRPSIDRRISAGTQGSRRSTLGGNAGLETHEEHAEEHAEGRAEEHAEGSSKGSTEENTKEKARDVAKEGEESSK